jgi:DNA-binding CsgD family transcriptional regulator
MSDPAVLDRPLAPMLSPDRAALGPCPPRAHPQGAGGFEPPAASGVAARPGPLAPSLLAVVLDEIDYGVMVVDAVSGALLHANRLALEEAHAHRTLDLGTGRVVAVDGAGQRALAAALQAVQLGRRSLLALRPAPGEAATARDGGPRAHGSTVQVSVVPLASESGVSRALLVFGKRQVADTLSVGFYARAHALTPTEDAVLLSLCRGLRPTQIASDHGVAISTVRTHVNSIRVKTGTASIRELVDRIAALPPMAPALRRCTH